MTPFQRNRETDYLQPPPQEPRPVFIAPDMRHKLPMVKVLYRDSNTLSLWGLPYQMGAGQQPSDIWRSRSYPDICAQAAGRYGFRISTPGPGDDWIWLGSPGWWGSMSEADRVAVQAWLETLADTPERPNEWCNVEFKPLGG